MNTIYSYSSFNTNVRQFVNKSHAVPNNSLKKDFENLEQNGIVNTDGIGFKGKKWQCMPIIHQNVSVDKLRMLINCLEATGNQRILLCDIQHCKIFKKRLKAIILCTHRLSDFKELHKQKFLESTEDFYNRILELFDEYKSQLTEDGVEVISHMHFPKNK